MKDNKKKRRISKTSKRRLLTLGVLSVILFGFFCVNVITYSYKIIKLTNEEKELVKKLDELKTEREYLLVDIEKLQDPDYLAKYARKTYYYTKAGEYVIKIDKDTSIDSKTLIDNNETLIANAQNELYIINDIVVKYKGVIVVSIGIICLGIFICAKKS